VHTSELCHRPGDERHIAPGATAEATFTIFAVTGQSGRPVRPSWHDDDGFIDT
jgi:hypothetical protein